MHNKATMLLNAFDLPSGLRYHISPAALSRWDASVYAAEDEASISIFDPIGDEYMDGVTPKRIAGVLRNLGGKDVTVNINSPGGSLSDGTAIYSLLKEHKGHVTVRVLGIAASAASIIAMAGDEILIARAGFMMIHNCWVMAVGNRNDLRAYAAKMEPFDLAMADIYFARTGIDIKKIQKMMDADTYIGGSEAVDTGFADELLPSDAKTEPRDDARAQAAARKADILFANQGMSRSQRRELISALKDGTPRAAESACSTPRATESDMPCAVELVNVITSFLLTA